MSKNYAAEAKGYILELSEETQRKAGVAITQLLKDGKDWQWICTALKKKAPSNWEYYGFGLMFNRQFNGAVHEQIRREQEFEEFDLNGFLESIDDGNCVNNPREERIVNQEYQPPQVRETANEPLWDKEELAKFLTGGKPANLSPTWKQDFRF